jgi:phosphatidylinositol alpha-1,6-mannosyltransferase
MRLLLITNDYLPKPGGIQQYLGNLVASYPHPIHVLAPADAPTDHEDVVTRHRSRFMWPTPAVAAWAEEQTARFRPDVILFGAPYPLPWLGPRLRARTGTPFGVLGHGAEITIPAAFPITRQLLARPMRQADVLFAVSRFTAGRMERLTRRTPRIIGAGIDTTAFHPDPEGVFTGVPPVLGSVSRFVPRKHLDWVIEAAAHLRSRGIPVDVLIVGRGRLEARLRRQAERLAVPVRFEVDVPWTRLGELYRAMDVFCMPCRSRWAGLETEGFGLVFLEAAASGLPVLAGDSGGAPETVVPGQTGFVVHSLGEIVEAMEILLADRDRARAMGTAGRERVEQEFTWDRAIERFVAGLAAVTS